MIGGTVGAEDSGGAFELARDLRQPIYSRPLGDEASLSTLMVQVPAHFDPKTPCIVTGTSSGSRGIYGAIGTSGEWGLQKGCAVAYTDKGSGSGKHDLATDTVGLIDGQRTDAGEAGADSHFTADLSPSERAAFLAPWPHRVAIKHAHSRRNPEAAWGRDTLDAVRFDAENRVPFAIRLKP